MATKYSDASIPSRSNYLNNKVVVVDGLVGGGKALISSIVGALPKVEMWVHRPEIEQICSMHHLGHITKEGAVSLLKHWFDQEAINLSIVRDINCRPTDRSSIFRDARPLRYLKRLFLEIGDASVQRIIDEQLIVNIMTHSNTGYALPIFDALSDRLVYIRFTRCPMTEYMLIHLTRWSKRWGKDIRSGMLLHKSKKNDEEFTEDIPFFMLHNEETYLNALPVERAILMLSEWQRRGDAVIDSLKKSSAAIIEIPFEKFVFDPNSYIGLIADALETNPDSVTKRMMKKQRVPRASLTDAPKDKVFSKLGWKLPKKHVTVLEEFDATRKIYKNDISTAFMKSLDEITSEYIKRHNIV